MNIQSVITAAFSVTGICTVTLSRVLIVVIVPLAIGACGGGGGDGSSGSEGKEGIRILHASIEAAPVDVLSNLSESPVVSQAFFAGVSGYHPLVKDVQTILLTRALSPSRIVASFEVDGAANKRSSLLLFGDVSTFGLRAKLFEDRVPEAIPQSVLRIVQGATGASAVKVQVFRGGELLVDEVVGFGDESAYLGIPHEESLQIVVQRAVDGKLLASPILTFEKDGAYTMLVAGEVDYYVKSVLYRDN